MSSANFATVLYTYTIIVNRKGLLCIAYLSGDEVPLSF
jgi:hypothetical protein